VYSLTEVGVRSTSGVDIGVISTQAERMMPATSKRAIKRLYGLIFSLN